MEDIKSSIDIFPYLYRMLEKEKDHLRFLIEQKILLNRKNFTSNKFIQKINQMIDASADFIKQLEDRTNKP